jgi:hypothetical protein
MVVLMLRVEEATLVDESVRPDTMHMSNKCSSSKSMSSNKCDGLSESNLSTLKVVAMVSAADRLLGRECMMTFRNPMLVELEMAQAAEDFRVERVVEVTGGQPHLRLDLKVLLRPMPQLDPRMLASPVRTIVAEAEVGSVVSIHMQEDEQQLYV